MHILNISQANETEKWLQARRGLITGTKSGSLALEHYAIKDIDRLIALADKNRQASLKARTAEKSAEYQSKAAEYEAQVQAAEIDNQRLKITVGFWQFMAETMAEEPDGENPAERGHRLENENAQKVLEALNISPKDAVFDTGMWVSDEDERLACSPDVHEWSDAPHWAIECKSLGTANHLAAVIPIMLNRTIKNDGKDTINEVMKTAYALCPMAADTQTRDYDFIPDTYKPQALQYFVVNPQLETLYFSFYDPRVYDASLAHVFLTITRESISEEIQEHRARQIAALRLIDTIRSAYENEF